MEPTTKAELIDRIAQERATLDALLAPLPAEELTRPGVEDDHSIKDLMAHVAYWERRTLTLLAYTARGERPPKLAREGEGDAWVDRVNGEVFAANRLRPLDDVYAEYRQSARDTLAALGGYSETELLDPAGLSRLLDYPALAIIAGDTYGHYLEHAASIRAWLARRKA